VALPLPVLARGPSWVVVAKPPRLLVHRNKKMRLEAAALQRVRDQVGQRVNPVHRLDRAASGCLLFATELERTGELHDALRHPDAIKEYVCLVRGFFWREGEIVVETPIPSERGPPKEARSVVSCLGTSPEPRCAVLRVRISSGRHHQVRRHVRDLDHPILGDADHGDSRENRAWRNGGGVLRLQLHCVRMSLPFDGGRIEVGCPLFADMAAAWRPLPFFDELVAAEPLLGEAPLPMVADVPVVPEPWGWSADDPRRGGLQ